MDNLHVDTKLTTLIRDDEDANGATASVESLLETTAEVGLVDDWQALLNITGLGHGNDWR